MKKQPTIEARSNPMFRNTPETLRYFYHPDHIGSTSWVTDSAKNGIQYCEYLPYKKLRFFSSLAFGKTNEFVLHSLPASVGEPFLDQRSTTWNSRYTFSGKERDGETGYSYFGARYYNSDISIWLSVDPLSDKYPNLSPYAYCANNPIILVDPDGKDWEVNEQGYIRQIGDPNNNVLYSVKGKEKNDFGDRITDKRGNVKSINVDSDIMNSLVSRTMGYSDETVDYSIMDVTGKDKDAIKMFRFLSKNTDVEWSYWGGESKEGSFSYLSTSHMESKDIYSPRQALAKSSENGLCFFFHSHPGNKTDGMFSNDIDRNFRNKSQEGSPNAVFGIMHQGILYELDTPFEINWDGTRK